MISVYIFNIYMYVGYIHEIIVINKHFHYFTRVPTSLFKNCHPSPHLIHLDHISQVHQPFPSITHCQMRQWYFVSQFLVGSDFPNLMLVYLIVRTSYSFRLVCCIHSSFLYPSQMWSIFITTSCNSVSYILIFLYFSDSSGLKSTL